MTLAAAALSLALPPCPGCAGGGEVNGLPCRDCQGSSRARKANRGERLLARLARLPGRAATAAGTAARWSMSLPGLAGAAGVSYGLAAVAHGLVHQVPMAGAVILVGAVFCLALDRRMP